jgi:hypothetical protein
MSTYAINPQALSIGLLVGLFATNNGIELPLLYGAAAFGPALTGFGEYSVDALLGVLGRWSAPFTWIVLVLGVAGGSSISRSGVVPPSRQGRNHV